MPISVGAVTGCCNARNFYNLGGAHGHVTAKDQDQFDEWMVSKSEDDLNFAITNGEQRRTREFLEKAGWKTHKVGYLYISTISGADFRAYNTQVRQKIQEKRRAEEANRRIEAQEKAKRLAETQSKLKFSDKKVFLERVTEEQIRVLCPLGNPRERSSYEYKVRCKNAIEDYYYIHLDDQYYRDQYGNTRGFHGIRDLVYSLVKKERDKI